MPGDPIRKPALTPAESETLMRRYQQADTEAASLLISGLSPQIFQFFLAQVRNRAHAEDLLQDFWLRIHDARRTYRPGEPVLPWLYAIARRVQIDDYRRKRRIFTHELQTERLPDRAASEPVPNRIPEMAELLKSLPESQRQAVLLLKVAGLSLEEAARAMGTTVGSMKQRAHRAYTTLRTVLGREA